MFVSSFWNGKNSVKKVKEIKRIERYYNFAMKKKI